MCSFEHKEVTIWQRGKLAELIKEYCLNIERELSSDCEEMLSIIDNNMLPNTLDSEAKVLLTQDASDNVVALFCAPIKNYLLRSFSLLYFCFLISIRESIV